MAVVLLIPRPRKWTRFANMSRRDSNSKHHNIPILQLSLAKLTKSWGTYTCWGSLSFTHYQIQCEAVSLFTSSCWIWNMSRCMMQWSIKYAKRGKTGINHSASANQVLDGVVFRENPFSFFFFLFKYPGVCFPDHNENIKAPVKGLLWDRVDWKVLEWIKFHV